ncbi:DNA-binding IclR family transcriptional regulator [Spinactinospora alkalitolerans]|uniref:DNA-binding IclR family transcriptional regulator n=1 Tax=Spinactinospora alkalitolerans TaxID=687207 RepID=A0A852TZJ4_9ACTN|nr:IclR family transcriptional regulator [Spinactinospora alkalitolerans]NYE48472.1 DNA-binding IclR family transcriptional regulator [Spinactinospora alkalitolerans]
MVNRPAAGPRGASPRNSSSSLRRALDLIEVVAEDHGAGGCSLTELAARSGLAKSTVIRLAAPLLDRGYLHVDADTGRYRLGPGAARLGSAYLAGLDLRFTAADMLRRLVAETAETVHLFVPDGIWMVYVDKYEAPRPVQMASRIGSRQPMYSTAGGLAYLSRADEGVVESVLEAGLAVHTPNTPSTPEALRSVLRLARERGYAVDDVYNEPHIRGVAAAVVDAQERPVAAISVAGPDYSLTPDRFHEIGEQVIAAAQEVSARLGA